MGNKRALLAGVNDYRNIGDLNGCLNDLVNMRSVLKTYFGFTNSDIRVVADDRATKQNILNRLSKLTDMSKAGDLLVFHFSGHGCFSGDTSISLLDGREMTFEQLVDEYGNGGNFWVYSCSDGKIVPGLAHSPRITKYTNIIEIVLDNGMVIKCTEDHKFMLRDGSYKEAGCLTKDDSLMPLYRRYSSINNGDCIDDYELCYIPNISYLNELKKNKLTDCSEYVYTHQLVSYHEGYFKNGYKGVIHHCDFNKRNNSPDNLKLMSRTVHAKLHAKTPNRIEADRARILRYNKETFPYKIKNDKEFRERFGKASSDDRKKDWQKESYRQKVSDGLKNTYDHDNLDNDVRVKALHENRWKSHLPEALNKRRLSFAKTINERNCKKNKVLTNTDGVLKNHKIVEIRKDSSDIIPVYDITVDNYHNFALSSGVFVHNSQIVRRDDKDELDDGMDELICPWDMDWDGTYITDNDLAAIFKSLKEGVLLEVFIDACHSGTMLDLKHELASRSSNTLDETKNVKERYLPPPVDIRCRYEGEEEELSKVKKFKAINSEVLWSGCKDSQTSADAYIDGSYNGAFTYYLCKHIRAASGKITRRDLMKRLRDSLKSNKYNQIPQLSSLNSDDIGGYILGNDDDTDTKKSKSNTKKKSNEAASGSEDFVKTIKTSLREKGFVTTPSCGLSTEDFMMIKRFQTESGIEPTGYLDTITLEALLK